jgi:hypothetical protein
MTTATMTKGEREDLQRLIRQREKVLKSAAQQRSAELLADFENQMGAEYSFDADATWDQATKAADAVVAKCQAQVSARCRELGIPDGFAPSLRLDWEARGYNNSIEKRKVELRRMATTRIEAIEQKAIVEIQKSCLEAQTQIAIAGLTSDAAGKFIKALPNVEKLMPAISFAEMTGEARPPLAEQLTSPVTLKRGLKALRQDNGKALQPSANEDNEP